MRALIIDPPTQERLQALKRQAEAHPIDQARLRQIRARQACPERSRRAPPIGDDPAFSCLVPNDFRVVYSIEQHPKGWMRHVSISVDAPGRYPNVAAVNLLLEVLGFRCRVPDPELYLYQEEAVQAINALEPIELPARH